MGEEIQEAMKALKSSRWEYIPPDPLGMTPRCGMRELTRLRAREPMVHAVLSSWEAGYFASFEDALITVACLMADRASVLLRDRMTEVEKKAKPVTPADAPHVVEGK